MRKTILILFALLFVCLLSGAIFAALPAQQDALPPGLALQATVDSVITQIADVRNVEHYNNYEQGQRLYLVEDDNATLISRVDTLEAVFSALTALPAPHTPTATGTPVLAATSTPSVDPYMQTITAVYGDFLTQQAHTSTPTQTPDYWIMTQVATLTYTETPQPSATFNFPTPTLEEIPGLEGDWAVVTALRLNVRDCASQACRAIDLLLRDHRVLLKRETCIIEAETQLEWCELERGGWIAFGIVNGDQYARWE